MSTHYKVSQYSVFFESEQGEESIAFNTFARSLAVLKTKALKRLLGMDEIDEDVAIRVVGAEGLARLVKTGTLVPAAIDEPSRFRFHMMQHKFRCPEMVIFVAMSSRCNLACPYCYQDVRADSTSQRDMSVETWRSALSFIRQRAQQEATRTLTVILYGGEPLVNYDVTLMAARDLRALKSDDLEVVTALVTNGSLLDDSRTRELVPLLNSIQVTIDGAPDYHNQNRPYADGSASYDDIVQALARVVQYKHLSVSLRMNFTADAADMISDYLGELRSELPSISKVTVAPSPIWPSQTELRMGDGCLVGPLYDPMGRLYLRAAKLGYRLPQKYVLGPCMVSFATSMSIDEKLNAYRCAGTLFDEPDARILEDGSMEILRPEWYQYASFEPDCAATCVYGPICYGGCRWRAGGAERIECLKAVMEDSMRDLVLAYVHAEHEPCLQA